MNRAISFAICIISFLSHGACFSNSNRPSAVLIGPPPLSSGNLAASPRQSKKIVSAMSCKVSSFSNSLFLCWYFFENTEATFTPKPSSISCHTPSSQKLSKMERGDCGELALIMILLELDICGTRPPAVDTQGGVSAQVLASGFPQGHVGVYNCLRGLSPLHCFIFPEKTIASIRA